MENGEDVNQYYPLRGTILTWHVTRYIGMRRAIDMVWHQ